MKISIIIPVYNVVSYLERCVLSVQKLQQEIEIILIDDGSTDGSGELCDKLALCDERIIVIHQQNSGLSCARNTGIRKSHGEYIFFLDADDLIDVDQADKMLKTLLEEKPVILLGLYQNYYDENRLEPEYCPAFMKLNGKLPINIFLSMMPRDGASCYMIACRFVVQKEYLLKNNLFFYPKIYHEDEEWTCRLLCNVEYIFVTHYLFYLYQQDRDETITSHVTKKHVWDSVVILERLSLLLETNASTVEKQEYITSRMAQIFLNILLNIYVLDNEEQEDIYYRIEKFRRICCDNMSGKIGNIVKILISIFGINKTCYFIKIVKKIKKRK